MDDAGLLARARQGDAVAFSRLFAAFERPVFRYAAHMCGRDAADDIVQETFLAVLRGSNRYDANRGTVGNYLFGIARHFVIRRLNARDAAALELSDADEAEVSAAQAPPSALDALSLAETIRAVRDAVATLPAPYREVVVLCELQEMSYAEAAEIVRCPVGTVRSRLHRARALLTSKLEKQRTNVGSPSSPDPERLAKANQSDGGPADGIPFKAAAVWARS